MTVRTSLLAATATLLACGMGWAGGQSAPSPERRRYDARRIAAAAPSVDGRLEDACWSPDRWARSFVQREPREGAEPSERTAFQVVYDDVNLYVAIRADDRDASRIESRVTRRDDRQGDQVEIYLDTYFDHLTAFVFNVNSAGVRTDFIVSGDGSNEDLSWDAVWYAATDLDEGGWTAEIAIPFTQLRFAQSGERVWGFQVRRRLHRREELSEWQLIPNGVAGFVNRFGELHGLDDVPAHRQIELLPYAVGRTERSEAETGNPFATGRTTSLAAGLDGKLAVTSDLTMTFTLNPDFGQVEADPSEVNLSTFETFFQERRPFFVEGANILDFSLSGGDGPFSQDNLFYSRRIGRPPQGDVSTEDGEHVDRPENTSILGAFKLTGKTRHGWSLGLLDGLTSAEHAVVDRAGSRRPEVIEPFANYFVSRVQKDFSEGRTVVGAMLTATRRDPASAADLELHRAAYSGGFDLRHGFRDRAYQLSVLGVFSEVQGDEATLLATQRAPRRYFQRPDADYVEVDPHRTSLAGHGGTLQFSKEGGGHLRFSTGVTWRSPGLELNDVGFLRTADQIQQWTWVGWRIWEPFGVFRSFNLGANQWRGWDFGGTNLYAGGNVNVNAQFRNYWAFGAGLNREGDSISNNELRGGPSLEEPGGWGHWLNVRSDGRRALRFNVGGWNFWGDASSSRASNLWIGATYRPSSSVSLSVEPFVSFVDRKLQYVDTVELEGSGNERYVLGRLDQTTVGITLRAAYSVSPNLSIQFYGQPFLSSGAYAELKRVTDPRADRFEERFALYAPEEIALDPEQNEYVVMESSGASPAYRFENPDFDFRQLRSNLVLRWELQPGSTLFVVWSQDRTGEASMGSFSFTEGLNELFRLQPRNVLLAKLSYRFSL